MPSELIEIFKVLGAGGIAFACFYLLLKSSSANMAEMIKNQAERAKETREHFNRILDSQQEQTRSMFKILEQMIDQNNLQLAYLQEIKTFASANLWCPIARERTGLNAERIEK